MDQERQERRDYIYRELLNKKYGILFQENGSLIGPKRPLHNGETPIFRLEESSDIALLDLEVPIKEMFSAPFSAAEHQLDVIAISDTIVRVITGLSINDFANVRILSRDEFAYARSHMDKEMKDKRGIVKNYHGVHMAGGLILIEDPMGNSVFPLLFHEVGHSIYHNENDNYTDEFRAMYFQLLSTARFEYELGKLGVSVEYPRDYYAGMDLPTQQHSDAFKDARMLLDSERLFDASVRPSEKMDRWMMEKRALLLQPSK